ncbi:MAG TPA: FAD-dependent monooxygenase [Pirellulales bacterium]|jgi:flavin-dependent dehydrogenase|nr:FAD-dependent monooxygenase [Pirellulales bacterium]
MERRWDAVIVGAGVAGACLSALLARRGWRVALIDAASFPRQKVCGEHLDGRAQELFASWGVRQSVVDGAVSLNTVSLVLGNGSRLSAPVAAGHGETIAISRHTLDEQLVKVAIDAGVAFFPDCRIRDVLIEGDRICGVESGDLRFRAAVTIAADGRESIVVRKTGRITRRGQPRVGFKRHVEQNPTDPIVHRDELGMFSLPQGYLGVAPVGAGSLNLCGVIPGRMIKAAGGLKPALQAWTRDHPALQRHVMAEGSCWWTVPRVQTQAARPSYSGVLYIGDARGTIEPLAGQGMLMGLASVDLAYRALTDHGEPALKPAAQQAYDQAWDRLFGGSIELARFWAKLVGRPRLLLAAATIDHVRRGSAQNIFRWCYQRAGDAMPGLQSLDSGGA